jgi:hypothetical protein
VSYYAATSRPVPSVTVRVTGATQQSTVSGGTGTYNFGTMTSGTVLVEPSRVGGFGSPTAITALDAAWILQAIGNLRTFSPAQRLACDVTGNGTLSALDASRILQRQVGIIPRLPVSDLCNSDWTFIPAPGPAQNQRVVQPAMTGTSCRAGAIALEPIVGAVTQQDFNGVLFGDCTGNWVQPTGGALRAQVASEYRVDLRVPRVPRGGKLRAPLTVSGENGFSAVDLRIAYDPTKLRVTAVKPLHGAEHALMVPNLGRPAEVRIAIASAELMPSGEPLLVLEFEAQPGGGRLEVVQAFVDDERARIQR